MTDQLTVHDSATVCF